MSKIFTRAFAERVNPEATEGTPIRFTASTEGIARDGLVIEANGWKLDAYRFNPIVLWCHDYLGTHLPIGKAVGLEVDDKRLVADLLFDQADDFARSIERKYRQGYLNAVSVGWNTLQVKPSKGMDAPRISEAELLDISAVPVPGDPDALIERQYAALRTYFESDTAPAVEDDWKELASRMVALFRPSSEDTDEERQKQYRALLPAYRRAGKTAPEFRALNELAALGDEEIRGLFLEGEMELCSPITDATRVGAVLNKRNRDDLEQAISLINGVLDRAKKEEPKEQEEEDTERDNAEELARLLQLKLKLGGL